MPNKSDNSNTKIIMFLRSTDDLACDCGVDVSSKGAVEGSLPLALRATHAPPAWTLTTKKKPFDILNNHIDEQPNRNRLGGLFRGFPFFFSSPIFISNFPFFFFCFFVFLAFQPPPPPLSLAFQDWVLLSNQFHVRFTRGEKRVNRSL